MQHKIGDVITNSLGMKFSYVPPGNSWIGGGGGATSLNMPRTLCSGAKSFTFPQMLWCGTYPVTQEEWRAVMGENPSQFQGWFWGNPRYPVESVSWYRVQDFLEVLNKKLASEGLTYRLPTEDEWEYVCRGGPISEGQSKFHFYFGKSGVDLTAAPTDSLSSREANFNGDWPAGSATKGPNLQHPTDVGTFLPNPLGIYDMHGNVWEWTDTLEGPDRVSKGGCWFNSAMACAAAFRLVGRSDVSSADGGLRLLAVPSAVISRSRRGVKATNSIPREDTQPPADLRRIGQ
ncbi:MAG: formylglycine-generating enzyme family protein [Planctomycetes bacterium]|nr:formylglycine-generating enzyme family protein [Planctomycetota bacterium]